MILKSSEKTDVNMTELVATVDAETFEKAIEAVYQRREDCVKELMAKAFSLKML